MQISRGLAWAFGLFSAFALAISLSTGRASPQMLMPLEVTLADGEQHELELSDMDQMEQIEFSTGTIWTDEKNSFSGVSLRALLEKLGANGTRLRLVALNDYSIEMPIVELEEKAPIIATRMNNETMTIRDKGPYWVVYPYDASPKYRTETHYARSVWQLRRLEVLE